MINELYHDFGLFSLFCNGVVMTGRMPATAVTAVHIFSVVNGNRQFSRSSLIAINKGGK